MLRTILPLIALSQGPLLAQYEWDLVNGGLISPAGLSFTDLDQDGLADLVIASRGDGLLTWARAIPGAAGSEAWAPPTTIARDLFGVRTLECFDYDGDGDTDLVTASEWARKLLLHENLGGGNFASPAPIDPAPDRVKDVVAFDADGDGDLDLAAALAGLGELALYENTGAGFGPRTTIVPGAGDVRDVDAADLDGDGDQDLVYVDAGSDSFSILENLGAGIFQAPALLGAGDQESRALAIGDVDGDGELEIVTGARVLRLYQRQSGAGLAYTNTSATNPVNDLVTIHALDVDSDGRDEIVFGTSGGGSARIARVDASSGQLPAFPGSLPLSNGLSFTLFDVTGDGLNDLVAAGGRVEFAARQPGGGFAPGRNVFGILSAMLTPVPLDLDADGDLDLLGVAFHNAPIGSADQTAIVWHERLGDDEFAGARTLTQGTLAPFQVQGGDVDGDGERDVIYLRRKSTGSPPSADVFWLRSRGTASGSLDFNNPQRLLSLPDVASFAGAAPGLALADLDGDGDLDLAATVEAAVDDVTLFVSLNAGGAQFGPITTVDSAEDLTLKRVVDVNGDGRVDLCAASRSRNLRIYRASQIAPGAFESPMLGGPSGNPRQAELAALDVDADGDLDFVLSTDPVGTNPRQIELYPNLGTSLGAPVTVDQGFNGDPLFVEVDLDGDGDQDVVIQEDNMIPEIRWHENAGGSLLPAATFATLDSSLPSTTFANAPGIAAVLDADGDADVDFLVGLGDQLRLYRNATSLGNVTCASNANSAGDGATLMATGSSLAAGDAVVLAAGELPASATTLFLVSRSSGLVSNPAGSQGNLCLGGAVGRYVGQDQVQTSDAGGCARLRIPLTMTPDPALGLVPILPGDTMYFQAWFRDANPGLTSNFSEALRVDFR